jgi:hypothetical protein
MSNILNPGTVSSTIYFTPYKGRSVPVASGTGWTFTDYGGELSQALSDATKSPAAAVTNTLYDMFVWQDGSTMRCTRGPAWSTLFSRSLALSVNNGFLVNSANITNGPLAGAGVYVGTIKTLASAVSCSFRPPGLAADNTSFGELDLWNYFNRINFAGTVQINNAASWTYNSATWRMAGGYSAYAVFYVCGIAEDFVSARYDTSATFNSGFAQVFSGIGVDITTVPSGAQIIGAGDASTGVSLMIPSHAIYAGNPGIGQHFLAAIEKTSATVPAGIFGAGNGGLTVQWKF